MKAVIYYFYDDICLENRALPSIAGHELLVNSHGWGLYGSDILKIAQQAVDHLSARHAGAAPLNLETLYQQELTLSGTYSSSPDELRLAFDLLTNGDVRVGDLISHRLPLSRFSEGVTLMRERAALKVYFQIAGE